MSSATLFNEAIDDIEGKRFPMAVARLKQIPPTDPLHTLALAHIGLCFVLIDQVENGLHIIGDMINKNPNDARLWNVQASAYKHIDQPDNVIQAYDNALQCDPKNLIAHKSLGEIFAKAGEIKKGISHFRSAIAIDPNDLFSHYELGSTLLFSGQVKKALRAFEKVHRLDPTYQNLWLLYSHTLFLKGQFDKAFDMYRLRFERAHNSDVEKCFQKTPLWQGEALANKSILCVWEQGLGDSLNFMRYLQDFKAAGATVHLCVQAPLVSLIQDQTYIDSVIPWFTPFPETDYFVSLMEIPAILNRQGQDFYRGDLVPYLEAPSETPDFLSNLATDKRKIGIIWQGNPEHALDSSRSLPLSCFEILSKLANTQVYSLQTIHGLDQIKDQDWLINFEPQITQSEDSISALAQAILAMDVIVCCDTMSCHLAGAMSKPVKLLTSHVPDWRWGLKSRFSEWYPKTEIFRRGENETWEATLKRVATSLED